MQAEITELITEYITRSVLFEPDTPELRIKIINDIKAVESVKDVIISDDSPLKKIKVVDTMGSSVEWSIQTYDAESMVKKINQLKYDKHIPVSLEQSRHILREIDITYERINNTDGGSYGNVTEQLREAIERGLNYHTGKHI